MKISSKLEKKLIIYQSKTQNAFLIQLLACLEQHNERRSISENFGYEEITEFIVWTSLIDKAKKKLSLEEENWFYGLRQFASCNLVTSDGHRVNVHQIT